MEYNSFKNKLSIQEYAKLSKKEIAVNSRWFFKQNELIIYEVFKIQKQQFYKLKNLFQNADSITLSASALFVAIAKVKQAIIAKSSKAKINNIVNIKSPITLRIKQMKRKSKGEKYEKLLNQKSTILELREKENTSFYEIARYLLKWHKLDVSHSWVRKFYNDIKEL